jgi:hypothetical protein
MLEKTRIITRQQTLRNGFRDRHMEYKRNTGISKLRIRAMYVSNKLLKLGLFFLSWVINPAYSISS